MIIFHLHNLREFMRMTSYYEFDDKPLARHPLFLMSVSSR